MAERKTKDVETEEVTSGVETTQTEGGTNDVTTDDANTVTVEAAEAVVPAPNEYAVLRAFGDKYTGLDYSPGDIVEFEPERAAEISASLGPGWIVKTIPVA